MCELPDRARPRPRGEWTRVPAEEVPAIAEQVVAELQRTGDRLAEALAGPGREEVRDAVERALLSVLGHRREPAGRGEPADRGEGGEDRGAGSRGEPPAAPVPIDRARRHLLAALTGDPRGSEEDLAELARPARWPLPGAVRAVVLAAPAEALPPAALPGDALAGTADGEPCLIVPDRGVATRAALESALRGRRAAVGHPVPPGEAPSSLRWARRLSALAPGRRDGDTGPVFVDDHLSTLLLLQDDSLARALSDRWLRPLEELTPRQSERIEATLLAWLEGGGAPEAARTLQVHPQTVRYRLRQTEKLFGPALRDPRARFELEMALRGRRLRARNRRGSPRAGRAGRTAADPRPLAGARQARVNGR
ncbi:PucR family transcriptional regulator [Streptomyces desertarenae]|uniref:PucR family transcriptional regulator n=1 Tax=Streptomyces desertarenae TaxID=2666184 RepID=A0ABW4PHB1_9ACTN